VALYLLDCNGTGTYWCSGSVTIGVDPDPWIRTSK